MNKLKQLRWPFILHCSLQNVPFVGFSFFNVERVSNNSYIFKIISGDVFPPYFPYVYKQRKYFSLKSCPPHTLAGFDLTTHTQPQSHRWQAETIPLDHAARAQ
jgi:hypothetical protein